MKRVHSLMFAAAVSVPISAASPAAADQGIAKPFAKYHPSHVDRRAIAHAHQVTRVAAIPADVACGRLWCRHDFVLMLGVGF